MQINIRFAVARCHGRTEQGRPLRAWVFALSIRLGSADRQSPITDRVSTCAVFHGDSFSDPSRRHCFGKCGGKPHRQIAGVARFKGGLVLGFHA